jgi:hypothetical protein
MSSSKEARTSEADLAERVNRLYQEAEALLASGATDGISEASIQQLMTAAVKLYVAKREAGAAFSPFVEDSVTATEVSITAHGMLKAADMQVFELSLWSGFGTV